MSKQTKKPYVYVPHPEAILRKARQAGHLKAWKAAKAIDDDAPEWREARQRRRQALKKIIACKSILAIIVDKKSPAAGETTAGRRTKGVSSDDDTYSEQPLAASAVRGH